MQGLRGWRVVYRGAWMEQAELERGLIRRLDRQPALVAVSDVGVDAKSQFFDVERKRFVLIAHIQADHIHTLSHISSLN